MFLEYSHNFLFVLAAVAVSLMASFTGLALTRGVSKLPLNQRKQRIAMASIALGGGIWAMHFVAMLGLQMPILFYYDALTTMISALTAILVVGIALLVMHFRERTRLSIVLAGTIAGLGISAMHYIGMSGMQLCVAVYTPLGILLALTSSVVLGIISFAIAYGKRTHRSIILGTFTFGAAVCSVHFLAMAGTNYIEVDDVGALTALLDNKTLALIVTLIAFFICGAFLLLGVTFMPAPTLVTTPHATATPPSDPAPPPEPTPEEEPVVPSATSVPYQKDGQVQFVRIPDIAALRAEGHYSILYAGNEKLFCPWSITQAEKRLPDGAFIRCHRSYLINPDHVTSFERKKDSGVCLFEGSPALGSVPVSRSRMAEVRTAFGLI